MNLSLNAKAEICRRARRITNRVMPPLSPVPHGFADPHGFVASCMERAARNQKYREVCASLFARTGIETGRTA